MSKANFSDEFKRDAVHRITKRGYPVAEVAKRLGASQLSLYAWRKKFSTATGSGNDNQVAEIRRFKCELIPVTEERDILKKGHRILRQGRKVRYAFVSEHRPLFSVQAMCRCLRIHPSGFYAWLTKPLSNRSREDARQIELIAKAWKDSNKVYGYRKLHNELLDQGETCGPNLVARLARLVGIKAQIGYKRRPSSCGGKLSVNVDNTLDRQFDVVVPDRVMDITYIRTHEGIVY
ncbi:MAG: IS3 family transposase, partial [Hyphomicrobiales bacterium]